MNHSRKFGLKMRRAILILTLLLTLSTTSQVSGQEKNGTELDKSKKEDSSPADQAFTTCSLIPDLKCEFIWLGLVLMSLFAIAVVFSSVVIAAAMAGRCNGFGVEAGEDGLGLVDGGVAKVRFVETPPENHKLREIPSRTERLVY